MNRLESKLGDILASLPENVGDRLAEASTMDELKSAGEGIRRAEQLKDARAQLANSITKLNKEAEGGLLAFFGIKGDAFTRTGGITSRDISEGDEASTNQTARDIISSLGRFDQGTGQLVSAREDIVSGRITRDTFKGSADEVRDKLQGLGFDPADLQDLFNSLQGADSDAWDDLSVAMQKNSDVVKKRDKVAQEAAKKRQKQLEIEKKAATAVAQASERWRKAVQVFSSALDFQVEMQDREGQSQRKVGLAAAKDAGNLTGKSLGSRGIDFDFGLKQQNIQNDAVTKVDDERRKMRKEQLGNIAKEITDAMEKAKGGDRDRLTAMDQQLREFFKDNIDLDASEFTKELDRVLQVIGQGDEGGVLDFNGLRADNKDAFSKLLQNNQKTLDTMREQLKIAENNWKTNREIAQRTSDLKSMGGFKGFMDPSSLNKPLDAIMDMFKGLDNARKGGFGVQEVRAGAGIAEGMMNLAGAQGLAGKVDFTSQVDPSTGVTETEERKRKRIEEGLRGDPGFSQMRTNTIGQMSRIHRERWTRLGDMNAKRFGEDDFRTKFARGQASRSDEIATRQFDEKFASGQIPQKQLERVKKN